MTPPSNEYRRFGMVLPIRPIPAQTRNRAGLLIPFKERIKKEACRRKPPVLKPPLFLRAIWFANHDRGDVDNTLKPICDALIGVVYEDDGDLVKVSAQRVDTRSPYTFTNISEGFGLTYAELLEALNLSLPDLVYVEVGEIRNEGGVEVALGSIA